MRIKKGSQYEEMTEALKQTDNHCPCVSIYARNIHTKCICKEFAEQETVGECHCGRYEKVEV